MATDDVLSLKDLALETYLLPQDRNLLMRTASEIESLRARVAALEKTTTRCEVCDTDQPSTTSTWICDGCLDAPEKLRSQITRLERVQKAAVKLIWTGVVVPASVGRDELLHLAIGRPYLAALNNALAYFQEGGEPASNSRADGGENGKEGP